MDLDLDALDTKNNKNKDGEVWMSDELINPLVAEVEKVINSIH